MNLETKVDIGRNVQKVYETVVEAAKRAGRNTESVKLVAVSKTISVENIKEALVAGITCLGENKVQEGIEKKPQLSAYTFEFHLIGHLQKNKVNKAVATFDWIESLDGIELARKIDQACQLLDKVIPVLIQVNLGKEGTKSGVAGEDVLPLVNQIAGFQHLSIRGLMTLPPFFENPQDVRPYFRRLRELSEQIDRLKIENVGMNELSMGMSHDYPIAIEEGATLVRVGTAIFGERPYA